MKLSSTAFLFYVGLLTALTSHASDSILFSKDGIFGNKGQQIPFEFVLSPGEDTITVNGSIEWGNVTVTIAYNAQPTAGNSKGPSLGKSGSLEFQNCMPGKYGLLVTGVTDFSGFDLEFIGSAEPVNVVLFLHGLAGDPTAWDQFLVYLRSINGVPSLVAPVISGGVILDGPATRFSGLVNAPGLSADSKGYYFYRIAFGQYDVSGHLKGADGRTAGHAQNGDYESFTMLGEEVNNAVTAILAVHPAAKIMLVGHSRGGLAGRAFLQGPYPMQKAAIVGFMTMGTPHNGSFFGLINPYLESTNGKNDATTQHVAKVVLEDEQVNALCPSVGFLATGGVAIKELSSTSALLPKSVVYSNYQYVGLPFGEVVKLGIQVGNIMTGSGFVGNLIHVSPQARKYMIGSLSPSAIGGDGIVQTSSQTLNGLVNPPRGLNLTIKTVTGGVFHTQEHDRTSDIDSAMQDMLGWQVFPNL